MSRCPYCKKDDKTLNGGVTIEAEKLRVIMYCFRCKRRWTEVYVFLHLEEDKEKSYVGQTENNAHGEQTCDR